MTAAYQQHGWIAPTFVPPADDDEHLAPVVLVVSDGTRPDPRRVQADLIEAWRTAGRPVTVAVCPFGMPRDSVELIRRWVDVHAFCGIRHQTVVARPNRVEQVLAYGEQLRQPAAGWAAAA